LSRSTGVSCINPTSRSIDPNVNRSSPAPSSGFASAISAATALPTVATSIPFPTSPKNARRESAASFMIDLSQKK
jgi:hypothetical protein